MLPPRFALFLAATGLALGAAAFAQGATNPLSTPDRPVSAIRSDMSNARRDAAIAGARARKLELQAQSVTEQAERTAHEAAALAARIQETEAQVAAQESAAALVAADRGKLRERLAAKQAPLLRLTASLQRLSLRPPLLALLRPGSLQEAVYTRALFDTLLPEVQRRTASLRSEIEQGRALERKALSAAQSLRSSEAELRDRRQNLATIEARQRLASRAASGVAAREADKALALAEKARDLGDLVTQVGRQGDLREQLAALPGPVMRPPRPEDSRVLDNTNLVSLPQGLPGYILPLTGRIVTGFGEQAPGSITGQARSRAVSLAARANAQAVAPAPGRIAYAGPYRGYGQIVIVEHPGDWTSLLTGLARLEVAVGDEVVAGSPLGRTGPGAPQVSVELRHKGEPVNPLQYLRPL